jgi:hypothetical protein
MAFVSRLLLVLSVLLLSGRLFASTTESFLLEGEDIASYQLDDTLILSQQEFITNSLEPAVIVGSFPARGHDILVVERNDEQALLADNTVMSGLLGLYDLVNIHTAIQVRPPSLKNNQTMVRNPTDEGGGEFCSEGCWSKIISSAAKGAGAGFVGGATGGSLIGTAFAGIGAGPGTAAGAAVGTVIGGIAGGFDGDYECKKDKATICKN